MIFTARVLSSSGVAISAAAGPPAAAKRPAMLAAMRRMEVAEGTACLKVR